MHNSREVINKALYNLIVGMKDSVSSSAAEIRKNFPKMTDEEFSTLVKLVVTIIDNNYNKGVSSFMRSVDVALKSK